VKSSNQQPVTQVRKEVSMLRVSRYQQFLETIEQGEMLIDELVEDLDIIKHNIHPLIRQATGDGILFVQMRANGGLYSITLRPGGWEKLCRKLRVLVDAT